MHRDKSVPPQPAPGDAPAIRSHIPNIYLNKYSSRRGDLLTMVMNDDSNIEYNNIFPQILSKNRKIAVNFSLEKMPERRAAFGGSGIGLTGHDAQRMGGEMYYELNYNQTEKKTIAATINGKRQKRWD